MTRSDELATALRRIRAEIPSTCTLIVVTKTFPVSDAEILYHLGERDFGENREDEGAAKSAALPDDARWHYQGEIQSKKIKSLVSWADYIHSLDDLSHATKINRAATEFNKQVKAFIQINLDTSRQNSNRGGIAPESLDQFITGLEALNGGGLSICGVMGVAPLNEDPAPAFAQLQEISFRLRKKWPHAALISAGMSSDYKVALKYGATHLRLGSSILGHRATAI